MICRQNIEKEPIRPAVHGIGLYFLLAGMDSFQIGPAFSILKLVAFVPLLLAMLDFLRLRVRLSAAIVVQLAFWLLATLSFLYSIKLDTTVAAVKTLSLNLALLFVLGVMEQYNKRELQYMQRALLLGGWVTILLMFFFSDVTVGGRLTLLLGAETQDQNYINGYFLYTFSWHCARLLLDKKKIHLIPTIFILAVMLRTGSRGALLAFAFVLLVHMCIGFAQTKHAIRNILLTFVLFAAIFWAFELILAQMPESVSQRFSWDYIAEVGTSGRTRIWRTLIRHFSEDNIFRMLIGHGYGTTLYVEPGLYRAAHNLYLDNLLTIGMVGLALQLVTQIMIIRILIKHRQYPLLGAYFGMIVMCLSLSLLSYKPIWNIMLLALAIDFFEKNNPATSLGSAKQEVHYESNARKS